MIQKNNLLFVVGADIDDEHPHGDLDRVEWDGVMGGQQIRGYEWAYLLEAYCARMNLCNYSTVFEPPYVFRRYPDKSLALTLQSFFSWFYNSETYLWPPSLDDIAGKLIIGSDESETPSIHDLLWDSHQEEGLPNLPSPIPFLNSYRTAQAQGVRNFYDAMDMFSVACFEPSFDAWSLSGLNLDTRLMEYGLHPSFDKDYIQGSGYLDYYDCHGVADGRGESFTKWDYYVHVGKRMGTFPVNIHLDLSTTPKYVARYRPAYQFIVRWWGNDGDGHGYTNARYGLYIEPSTYMPSFAPAWPEGRIYAGGSVPESRIYEMLGIKQLVPTAAPTVGNPPSFSCHIDIQLLRVHLLAELDSTICQSPV